MSNQSSSNHSLDSLEARPHILRRRRVQDQTQVRQGTDRPSHSDNEGGGNLSADLSTSSHGEIARDSPQQQPTSTHVETAQHDDAAPDEHSAVSDERSSESSCGTYGEESAVDRKDSDMSNESYTRAQLNALLLNESRQDNIKSFNTVVEDFGWNSNCTLLGAGAYAIVYRCHDNDLNVDVAVKVQRIRAKFIGDLAEEVTVSGQVSRLSQKDNYNTSAFIKLHRVHYVTGLYPPALLEAWRNDNHRFEDFKHKPHCYEFHEEYMVFVYEIGGTPMFNFTFTSAKQIISVAHQLVAGLAVAGEALGFAHNDLHMDNILVSVDNVPDTLTYHFNRQKYEIPTYGIRAKMIDFSRSTSFKAMKIRSPDDWESDREIMMLIKQYSQIDAMSVVQVIKRSIKDEFLQDSSTEVKCLKAMKEDSTKYENATDIFRKYFLAQS